ncbi:hypothetical protein LFWB_6600 [Candidatus Phytoplasma luffae]|uniref:Uncharacterized protein n=1 Tax=Loofah witches'-broom phytoplasma TaxID=35773 RepID=A0A975FJY4_LOWBP|nr:hypothetical protein [Candidatus Phytoplasma luffae]QTX03221.1 hypothetical protein LFWB_6600 [Candidatus Phytoplasma luffae]
MDIEGVLLGFFGGLIIGFILGALLYSLPEQAWYCLKKTLIGGEDFGTFYKIALKWRDFINNIFKLFTE